MITVKADDRRRVLLPDIKPGQVFCVEVLEGSDAITLTPLVKGKPKQRPYDPHMYDDLRPEEIELEAAAGKVDVSSEERDRE
jgi:hypothetical protein